MNILPKTIKKMKAFTLAEVLIVLGIIGVVAAFTIPTLMQKTQDRELKASWKKEYSAFANATNQILSENGGTMASAGITSNDDTLRDLYGSYMHVIKKCDRTGAYQNSIKGTCWHNDYTWKQLNNGDISYGNNDDLLTGAFSGFVLADGSMAKFSTNMNACANGAFGYDAKCGYIIIDVNGFKKPNVIGRDIFGMTVFGTKLAPFDTATFGNCDTSSTGWGCAAYYLYQQ